MGVINAKPEGRHNGSPARECWVNVVNGDAQRELKVVAVSDPTQVKCVVEKFRGKYGTSDVNLYLTVISKLRAGSRSGPSLYRLWCGLRCDYGPIEPKSG
jgi:hypothetical protein